MATRRQFHTQLLGLAAAGLQAAGPAAAQGGYPQHPLKIIVPYAAGGGPDVLTRKMAVPLGELLGVAVVVDNIVGAGGILAAQQVARMAPDGYNLLQGASTHVVQKAMQPQVRFDPVQDFVHVTRTAFSPAMLVVNAASPYRSVDELVQAARRAPGTLNYASGGIGSLAHLCGAAMALRAQIEVVHVPYKGSVEIVPSLLSGATQFACPVASTAIPLIRSGKIRPLAVTGAQRMPAFPEVPALAEVFQTQDLALVAWEGMWLPARAPAQVVDRLFQALTRAYADAGVRADYEAAGSVVATSASPAEFTRFVETETRKFEQLVQAARLRGTN